MLFAVDRFAMQVLFICAFCSRVPGQEHAPVTGAERGALLALYHSTDGPRWINHSGWLGPPQSECSWFGVACGFDHEHGERQTITALSLEDNNLAGTLPAELNTLDLDELRLSGNHLSGSLPKRLLDKWLAGPLRLSGYASQFNPQIEEIVIRRRTAILCTDYEASLRPDGTVTMRSEKCRGSSRKPTVYCEVKSHHPDALREEIDRLAWFMETSGFFDLENAYSAPMTHGGTFEVEALRRGQRQKVADYGAYGPQKLWAVERLISGILENASWDKVGVARDSGFTVRDR
jgi:hypothetical protein